MPASSFCVSNEQMIDWRQVALNAANVSDATFWSEEEKRGLSSMYAEFIDESTPKIAEVTRLQSGPIKNIKVFDRYDWIETNVKAILEQFAPLDKIVSEQTEGSLIGRRLNKSSQVISTLGLGLLLGYLAKRVLGQYDPSLLGREPVLRLVVHHRLRAVDHLVGHLVAAVRRQRVHVEGAFPARA